MTVTAIEEVDVSKCQNCGEQLVSVFATDDIDDTDHPFHQYVDALSIRFTGYYGGYFDRLEPEFGTPALPEVFICKVCADKLITENPWIQKIIDLDD